MAFEDDATKPKNRKFLFWGLALLLAFAASIAIWQLKGGMLVLGAPPLALRLFNLALFLAASWSLVVHFRGPNRPFSSREKRYWWSYLLPIPFMIPLFAFMVKVQPALVEAERLANEDQRREALRTALSQPISPWFAAIIAVSLAIGFAWSLLLYFRNMDEQELQATLWASTFAFLFMSLGALIWHFLWIGGLAPPIGVFSLVVLGTAVMLGTFIKLKFF